MPKRFHTGLLKFFHQHKELLANPGCNLIDLFGINLIISSFRACFVSVLLTSFIGNISKLHSFIHLLSFKNDTFAFTITFQNLFYFFIRGVIHWSFSVVISDINCAPFLKQKWNTPWLTDLNCIMKRCLSMDILLVYFRPIFIKYSQNVDLLLWSVVYRMENRGFVGWIFLIDYISFFEQHFKNFVLWTSCRIMCWCTVP